MESSMAKTPCVWLTSDADSNLTPIRNSYSRLTVLELKKNAIFS